MYEKVLLIIFIIFLFHNIIKNKDVKEYYKICSTVLNKQKLIYYIIYLFVVLGLSIYLLRKYNSVEILVISIFLLFLPLYFIQTKISINYDTNESQIFKTELKSESSKNLDASHQLVYMPFYANKNKAGHFYSSAEVIKDNSTNKSYIIQTITYVFEDSEHPKGTLSVRFAFENEQDIIFPKDGEYIGHIISGSENYSDFLGKIKVNVSKNIRNVEIILQ